MTKLRITIMKILRRDEYNQYKKNMISLKTLDKH